MMKITDAHQHFWAKELFAGKLPPEMDALLADFRPEDLKPHLDELGIQQTVLVQTHSSLKNNQEFLDIADACDWVGAVVGWVDLTDPRVGKTLDRLVAHPKFKGVRHQWEDEKDPAWIMRADVLRGLREVAQHGLRYDLLARPPNWPYLTQVAEAVPDLPLVIDHIAKPNIKTRQFDDWAATMARAAEIPRMMCKVSGMVTEADWQRWQPADLKPYITTAIELFGADRVMWGSDWPVCLLAGSYAQVFNALLYGLSGLSEQDKARILGENARRFYGIA
jgi:L-fuconolactonase